MDDDQLLMEFIDKAVEKGPGLIGAKEVETEEDVPPPLKILMEEVTEETKISMLRALAKEYKPYLNELFIHFYARMMKEKLPTILSDLYEQYEFKDHDQIFESAEFLEEMENHLLLTLSAWEMRDKFPLLDGIIEEWIKWMEYLSEKED